MTTQTATEYPVRGILAIVRTWLASGRHQAAAALGLYVVISIGYFGLHVLPHLGSATVGLRNWTDPTVNIWSLEWWPYAVLHGLNPLVTQHAVRPGPHRPRRHQPDVVPTGGDSRRSDHDRVRPNRRLQPADAGEPGARGVLRLPAVPVHHPQLRRESLRRLRVRLLHLHPRAHGRSSPTRADLSHSGRGSPHPPPDR